MSDRKGFGVWGEVVEEGDWWGLCVGGWVGEFEEEGCYAEEERGFVVEGEGER